MFQYLQEPDGGKIKNRPIKEWLFFAFVALGIACSLILPLTIMTYLDYAGSGYGLEAEVDGYSMGINNDLLLNLTLTNPGKLEMKITGVQIDLGGSGERINGTIPGEIYDLESEGVEDVTFTFSIPLQTVNDRLSTGLVEFELRIDVYIPHRDAYTTRTLSGAMEVV